MKIKTKSYFSQALMVVLSLLFLITSVNLLQNFGRGTTDLSENSIADAPTNTTYWIDDTTQTALGVDFDNYSLTKDTSASATTYLIQSETDLAFLSWTIYNDQVYGGSDNKYTSGNINYFYSDVCFKQTKNLDLSAYYWQPIGIYRTRTGTSTRRCFSGNYDGGGYIVSGVFTPAGSSNGYSHQGLFGAVVGRDSTQLATIQNIGVIDSFVQGYNNVGGVVGYASSYATISNVYNTGSVNGSSSVGGVVGYEYTNSTVSNVYNTGSVSGRSYVGGVVGSAGFSTVSNVYNTGSVRGSSYYVGGVVGSASGATITNTYYGGHCEASVGGINGADVDGQAEYLADLEVLAKNEEWYLDSSNWDSSCPWNFETVWAFVSGAPNYVVNNGYPYLQSLGIEIPEYEIFYWTDEVAQEALGVDFDNYTLTQDTSASTTTYLIQSETDLAFLSWTIYNDQVYGGSDNKYTIGSDNYFYSGIYFKQTTNLDLSAYYWQPIGIGYTRDGTSADRYFSGNYDGGGYTVSGVFTPAGSGDAYFFQGLFGYVRSSTLEASIANVGVIDSFVQGYYYVGGVVGRTLPFNVTVSNVYNTGSVSGSYYVGGVVGHASSSIVRNVYNTGIVSGRSDVGGVVGQASSSTISNAYNTGSVSGSSSVGGVVGNAAGTVSNAYNTGSVSGSSSVGGVVGRFYSSATVTNTYYGGDCEAIGGIKGEDVDGQAEYLADLEVLAKNEEWYSAEATLEDGSLVWNLAFPWDFDFTWLIDSTQNDGYPVLYTDQNRPEIHYWIDEYVQTEKGVDFTNYTLSSSETETDTYLIQSETDLAFLSWTHTIGNL